jgi:hypothetical protein
MVTKSPLFAIGVKVIGLTAIAVILLSGSIALGTTVEEEGAPEVESDGGLTATLNGVTFGRGDTVSVSGTVEERDGSASMYATIIDPAGIEISTDSIAVGSDLTFRYGFVAGEDDEMTTAGTYTVQIQYFPPGDADIQSVTLDFEYNPEAATTTASVGNSTISATTTAASGHINPDDGFRIQVPEGWIISDVNNTLPVMQLEEQQYGSALLAELCPQEGAIPQIGGELSCTPSEETPRVLVVRYANLTSRPEFAILVSQGQNITLSDFTAFWIQGSTEGNPTIEGYDVEENEERTVGVFDRATNTTLEGVTVPARWISLAVGVESQGFRATTTTYSGLLLLGLDGNTGYSIIPIGLFDEDGDLPEGTDEAIDSFELLATNSSGVQQPTTAGVMQSQQDNTTTTTSPFSSNSTISTNSNETTSPPPEQQQQPPSPPAPQLVL